MEGEKNRKNSFLKKIKNDQKISIILIFVSFFICALAVISAAFVFIKTCINEYKFDPVSYCGKDGKTSRLYFEEIFYDEIKPDSLMKVNIKILSPQKGISILNSGTSNLTIDMNKSWKDENSNLYFQGLFNKNIIDSISQEVWITIDSLALSLAVRDSMPNYYVMSDKDITHLVDGQRLVLERQDALVQDFRQESNNLINKVNGWIGFWIGIIALLGVFVPVAMQYKLNHDSKEQKDLIDKEFEEIKNNITEKERDLDLKTTENIEKFRNQINVMHYTTLVRSFNNICDNPEIEDMDYRRGLLYRIWNELLEKLDLQIRIFCDYNCDNSRNSNRKNYNIQDSVFDLTSVLIMTANVLNRFARLSPRRNRRLRNLYDETIHIISDLYDPAVPSAVVNENINTYFDSLRALVII